MVKRFLRPVIIGAVVGALCCTLLLAVMAAIVASQDIPKAAITPMAIVAAAAGAFFGGFAAARIAKAVEQVQSAFHKQLDALNEFRFINLESEMDVLADMLKSDGLTAEPDAPAVAKEEPQEDDPFASLFAKGEKK